MSKRILILILILAVVISFAVLENSILSNTFENLKLRLEQIDVAIQTETIHQVDVNELIAYWEKQKRYLCMLIPHIEIRSIETYLYQLKNAVECNEYFEAMEYVEVLRAQTESIPKTFVLCLENIL